MLLRKNFIRPRVVEKHDRIGKTEWDSQKTMEVCIDIDNHLESEGHNPAPKFRKAVKDNNMKYTYAWTLGCHFDWLNPR
jgi:hypothetical protein